MKYTIKNPRKIIWAMRDFINTIHTVEYERCYIPADEDFSEGWLDRMINEQGRAVCKLVPIVQKNFCAFMNDKDEPIFRIGYNFDYLFNYDLNRSRNTFTSRSSVCKGFANITLILLHELGHFSSQQDFDDYDRETELEFIRSIPYEVFAREMYFLLPDEVAATEWAVEWLQDAEHRKIAEEFEKKFFACLKRG